MRIINLDVGVRNSLKAFLCEGGRVSEQDALDRIEPKLEEAVQFVMNQINDGGRSQLFEVQHREAFKALKVWAATNI